MSKSRTPGALRALASFVLAFALLIGGGCAMSANLAHASDGHSVALSDARQSPTRVTLVKAGTARYVPATCAHGTLPSDLSAYRWDGARIGGMTFRPHGGFAWRGANGRHVTYRAGKWSNRTGQDVLVAWWCE